MGKDQKKSDPEESVSSDELPEVIISSDAEKQAEEIIAHTAERKENGSESGTLVEWLDQPVETAKDGLIWAGLGIAVGVLVALAVVLITSLCRGKKNKGSGKVVPETGKISVEKLHEQGARKSQQDSFFVSQEGMAESHGLLAVVADGMGGLTNGDRTSQEAVTAVANGFYAMQGGTPEQVVGVVMGKENQAVKLVLGPDGIRRSGTTMVAGLIRNNAFHYLSVGDSRICLYRGGVLYQLNREHVLRNELTVQAINGEISFQDIDAHPKAAGLTSFLGMGRLKYVDQPAQAVMIQPGDKFILMSDGVYNALSEQEMVSALERGDGSAAEALNEMIRAKNYSNQDNYTAVILNC